MLQVRCKFRLTEIITTDWGHGQQKKYIFQTQYDESIPEDMRFQKASPSGRFEIVIDNPVAQAAYEIGAYYYFDSTPVPAPDAVAAA